MQTHQRSRTLFRQSKVVNFLRRTSLVVAFGLLCAINVFGSSPTGAEAQTHRACVEPTLVHYSASNEISAVPVAYNDVSQINTTSAGSSHVLPATCSFGKVAQPDVLSSVVNVVHMRSLALRTRRAVLVTPGHQISQSARKQPVIKRFPIRRNVALLPAVPFNYAGARYAPVGAQNPYPYGQCTWWADQRYYQLHGVRVPWTTNANAWQWTARAIQFGWNVSAAPQVGDIMVLQPYVQGAYGLGHVAVVEKVLSGESVIASSMNWGVNRGSVTDAQFYPGPGVAFISQ